MNLGHRGRPTLWLAMAIAIAAAESIEVSAQGKVFKSGVDLVPLTVTVTDARGNYVTGLTSDDFEVFEDGERQSSAFFAGGELPLDVALVLDTSSSMAESMPMVRKAATGLIRTLRSGDRSAVTAVSTTIAVPQPLTSDLGRVAAAIDGLRASGGTALYDGLYMALNELARQRREWSEARRQVLVLLSDGIDTASHVTADDVARVAGSVGVNVYVIALTGPKPVSQHGRDMTVERAAYQLRALAQDSGGRVFRPTTALDLPAVYDAIARELASQYRPCLSTNPVRRRWIQAHCSARAAAHASGGAHPQRLPRSSERASRNRRCVATPGLMRTS